MFKMFKVFQSNSRLVCLSGLIGIFILISLFNIHFIAHIMYIVNRKWNFWKRDPSVSFQSK